MSSNPVTAAIQWSVSSSGCGTDRDSRLWWPACAWFRLDRGGPMAPKPGGMSTLTVDGGRLALALGLVRRDL